ncbi:hypothetical protein Q6249_29720, partial [Klebsiella pneumoniae]|uniref:hypothetical protein n=1 Tax=Klebsiella pneumoniae TaxID=573 RepID=UPI00272EF22C
ENTEEGRQPRARNDEEKPVGESPHAIYLENIYGESIQNSASTFTPCVDYDVSAPNTDKGSVETLPAVSTDDPNCEVKV